MTWSQRASNILLYTIYITSLILMIICIVIFSYYNSILQTYPDDPSRAHEHYFRGCGCALLSFFVTANAMIVFRVFGINLITIIWHAGLQCVVLLFLIIRLAAFPTGDKKISDSFFRVPLYIHVATFLLQIILGFYLMVFRPGSTPCSQQKKSGAHVLLGLCSFLIMFWYIAIYLNTSCVDDKHGIYSDALLSLPSIVAVFLFLYVLLILFILLMPIFRTRRSNKSQEPRDREIFLVPCAQYSPAERKKLIWEDTTGLLTSSTSAFQNIPPSTQSAVNVTIKRAVTGQYCCTQQIAQTSGTAMVLKKEFEELFCKWRPRVSRTKTFEKFELSQRSCGETDTDSIPSSGIPQNLLKSILKSKPQYTPGCCKCKQTQSNDFLEDNQIVLKKGATCLRCETTRAENEKAILTKPVILIIDKRQDDKSLSSSFCELIDEDISHVRPLGESRCLKWMKSGYDIGLSLSRALNKNTGRENTSRTSSYVGTSELESTERIKDFRPFMESPENWAVYRQNNLKRKSKIDDSSSEDSDDSVSESETDCDRHHSLHSTKSHGGKVLIRSRSMDIKWSPRHTTENMLAANSQRRLPSGKEEASIQSLDPETHPHLPNRNSLEELEIRGTNPRSSYKNTNTKAGNKINVHSESFLNARCGSTHGVKLERSRSLDVKRCPIYTFVNNRSDVYQRRLLSGKEESNINPSKQKSHCPKCCCKCSRKTARESEAKRNETSPTASHSNIKSEENREDGNFIAAGLEVGETPGGNRPQNTERITDYKDETRTNLPQWEIHPVRYCCKCSSDSPIVLETLERNEEYLIKKVKNIKIDAIITGDQSTGIFLGGRVYLEMEQRDITQRGVRNNDPAPPSLSENSAEKEKPRSYNRLIIKECSCSHTASHTKACQDICFCKGLPKDGNESCNTSDEELKSYPVVLKKVCYQTPSQMMKALLNDAEGGADCSCKATNTQNAAREIKAERSETSPRRSFEDNKMGVVDKDLSSLESIEEINRGNKNEEDLLRQIRKYSRMDNPDGTDTLPSTSPKDTESSHIYSAENIPAGSYQKERLSFKQEAPIKSFNRESHKQLCCCKCLKGHVIEWQRKHNETGPTINRESEKEEMMPEVSENANNFLSQNWEHGHSGYSYFPGDFSETQYPMCCCKYKRSPSIELERDKFETSPTTSHKNFEIEATTKASDDADNFINQSYPAYSDVSGTQLRKSPRDSRGSSDYKEGSRTRPSKQEAHFCRWCCKCCRNSPSPVHSPTLSQSEYLAAQEREMDYKGFDNAEYTGQRNTSYEKSRDSASNRDNVVIDDSGAVINSRDIGLVRTNNEMKPDDVEDREQNAQFTRRLSDDQINSQTAQMVRKIRNPTRYPTSFRLDQMPDSKLRRLMNLGPAKPSQNTQAPIAETKSSVPPCSFLPIHNSRHRSRGNDCVQQDILQCDLQENFLMRDDPGCSVANNTIQETCSESPGDRYIRLRRHRSLPATGHIRFYCPPPEQVRRQSSLPRNCRDFC